MSASDSESDQDEQGNQVRVSLKLGNSVRDRSLEVSREAIAVPADIGRKGLTAVLNHLLGRSVVGESGDSDDESDEDSDDEKLPPLSFEFIVKGASNRLLRKGVEKEARQNGLSLEEAISITYFPAANIPERQDDGDTLPDWVSCLSACNMPGSDDNLNNNFVFSGCYDGSIHAYKRKTDNSLIKVDFKMAGTSGPIKAMATSQIDDKIWIASASLDHTLNIHTFESENGNGRLQSYGQCVLAENELGLSSSAFTSLDFSSTKSTNILASGNGNGKISIWNVKNVVENNTTGSDRKRQKDSSRKKSKPSSSDQEIEAAVHFENSHSQSVTGLSWGNHNKLPESFDGSKGGGSGTHLVSGSWDHSIKLWDVEKENCLLTLNGARVVSCLDTSYHSEGIVATGHPDCTIRLWDLRTNSSKQNTVLISDNSFRPSHKAWVSGIKWSQSNAYQLASTSHDGSVKIWDIRSSNPLHTVRTFPKEEKGLSLLWLPSSVPTEGDEVRSNEAIYAGGTDCIIKRLEV
jgi:ribosome biogenesis protein YTM1